MAVSSALRKILPYSILKNCTGVAIQFCQQILLIILVSQMTLRYECYFQKI